MNITGFATRATAQASANQLEQLGYAAEIRKISGTINGPYAITAHYAPNSAPRRN